MIARIGSAIAMSAVLAVAGFFSYETVWTSQTAQFIRVPAETNAISAKPQVEHVQTPESVKALYMSQCAAASPELRTHLLSLADETEINAVVVDIKDYTGTVVFPSKVAMPDGIGCATSDFRGLVKTMHEKGIYVIGRLTVFQDPLYTKVHPDLAVQSKSNVGNPWRDYKGLSFVDVGAVQFWDYIVAIAKEAHDLGVDEINFDYIRYPSDGNMSDVAYAHSSGEHADNLERFFRYLSGQLKSGEDEHEIAMSADLFGMTATNYDDLSIGQVLERALPYFDYIAPMVYPSHYPPRFNGWANPNDNVYGVVKYSMDRAVPRVVATTTPIFSFAYTRMGTSTPAVYKKPAYDKNVLRPWLQDFDYGGNYGPVEVRAQIQAAYDAGLNSWMLWDPANKYTREALESSDSKEVE